MLNGDCDAAVALLRDARTMPLDDRRIVPGFSPTAAEEPPLRSTPRRLITDD